MTQKTAERVQEEDRSLFKSVGSGFVSLFVLQIVSRVLTFTLNVFIARAVDRSAYGVGAVQLQLVSDTILMLSREGFRDACQRTSEQEWKDAKRRTQILQIAWLSGPVSVVTAVVVVLTTRALHHGVHMYMYAYVLAALVEMAAEPLYILAHNMLLIRVRVRVEMAAVAARVCAIALIVVIFPQDPLMAFASGQLVYSATTFVGLVGYFTLSSNGIGGGECARVLLGRAFAWGNQSDMDVRLLKLSMYMSGKTVIKYLLERGELFVLLATFSSDTWALYSIVQNLGSLVVRLIFFPVEDMSQLLFSKLIRAGNKGAAGHALAVVLRLVILIGCTSATFGPGYAYTVVHVLYGTKWSETDMPNVLSWYSYYLPFMALNGVSEAFLHASATPAEIATRTITLVPVTAIYLCLATILAPKMGVSALIIGCMISMAVRVLLSLAHARRVLSKDAAPTLLSVMPSVKLLLYMLACGLLTYFVDAEFVRRSPPDEPRLAVLLMHVVLAVGLLLGLALGLKRWDKALVTDTLTFVRGEKDKKL